MSNSIHDPAVAQADARPAPLFRDATVDDVPALVALVQSAYRGESSRSRTCRWSSITAKPPQSIAKIPTSSRSRATAQSLRCEAPSPQSRARRTHRDVQ